jgi:hypothetical protein
MNWNGNIITEGVVIENIDGEEEDDVEYPTADGNLVSFKEETTVLIKLSDESRHSDEEKLNKRQESSCNEKNTSVEGPWGRRRLSYHLMVRSYRNNSSVS